MGREHAVNILNEMSPDDRTTLLEELPPETVKGLVASLSPSERAVAQHLLGYPEGSVGRLMTPDFIAIRADWTVQQVLDDVRARGSDSETLNVLYVVDDHGKLIDDLRIREFLTRPLDTRVNDLMNDLFVTLAVTDTQASAVALFRKYDRTVLPVVDKGGRLDRGGDGGRRARRGRGGSDGGRAQVRRPRSAAGPAVHEQRPVGDVPQAGLVSGDPLPGRNADGHRHAIL